MNGCYDCKYMKSNSNHCSKFKEKVPKPIKKYGCDDWVLDPALDDGREPLGNGGPIY